MACHSLSLMMIHLVSVRERKTTLGILSRKGCDCGELVTNGVQIQNRKAGVGKREKGLAYQRLESCCYPRCSHKHKKNKKKKEKEMKKPCLLPTFLLPLAELQLETTWQGNLPPSPRPGAGGLSK